MRYRLGSLARIAVVPFLMGVGVLHAQSQTPTPAAPTLFRMTGALQTPAGEPRTGVVVLVASLYNAQDDAASLWSEAQTVTLDPTGRYSIVVGSSVEGGVPKEYFLNGTGRWLGVGVQNEAEQPRVMLISVPYALKAVEADTLSGKTAAEFVLAENLGSSVQSALRGRTTTALISVASTTNAIAKFTDGIGTVGNSNATDNGGNIGIGTTTPGNLLHVYAGVPAGPLARFQQASTSGYAILQIDRAHNARVAATGYSLGGADEWYTGELYNGGSASTRFSISTDNTLASSKMVIQSDGNVGIGTTIPNNLFHVYSNVVSAAPLVKLQQANTSGYAIFQIDRAHNARVAATAYSIGGADEWYTGELYNGGSAATKFSISTDNTLASSKLVVQTDGNVGIGTTTPTARLDVNGNINVAGNINAKYQDVAEWVETSSPLEPGTVVTVDPAAPNRVLASAKAYDTRVAGAVSKQPGLILGEAGDTKAMVAQSGRVRIKVDASYGAIRVGDLLVTSPTPGYAMRSRPVMINGVAVHRAGTLLGKALEALPKGKGEILVLLTLQ